MYEKILAFIGTAAVIFGTIWFICGRRSNGRTSSGTESNARRVREDIDRAADNNKQLKEAEQRARESLDRAREAGRRSSELAESAGRDTARSQELIQKARDILGSAKHTD